MPSLFLPTSKSLAQSFTMRSMVKLILNYSEKIIIIWFGVSGAIFEKGAYAAVNKFGIIIIDVLLHPLEEIIYVSFGRLSLASRSCTQYKDTESEALNKIR